MKYIFKYNESVSTRLESIPVEDNHVLQPDELETLPADFLTPAKLVNGKIVSATKEESDETAKNYLKEHGYDVDDQPTEIQQQMIGLSKQIIALNADNADLKKQVADTQNQVIVLSKTILGGA